MSQLARLLQSHLYVLGSYLSSSAIRMFDFELCFASFSIADGCLSCMMLAACSMVRSPFSTAWLRSYPFPPTCIDKRFVVEGLGTASCHVACISAFFPLSLLFVCARIFAARGFAVHEGVSYVPVLRLIFDEVVPQVNCTHISIRFGLLPGHAHRQR